jgi:hypothetical protein
MIYRDDLAVALGRIEALERENEQLRSTNHELSFALASKRMRDYRITLFSTLLTMMLVAVGMMHACSAYASTRVDLTPLLRPSIDR